MIKNLHLNRLNRRSLAIAALAIFIMLPGWGWGQNVDASFIQGTSGAAWWTAANWSPTSWAGVKGAAISNTNTATFTSSSAPVVGINMGTASLSLGAISIDNTRNLAINIGNSSVTAGTMALYGTSVNSVANTILRNNGTGLFTLQASQSGTMGVILSNATENIINIDGTGGITISAIISGASKNLTKTGSGSGVLTLSGANTYLGNTTISAGTLALSSSSSISASPIITIGSTGTFDVTGLTTALALGSTQTLKASATGSNTTGTVTITSTKGLTLGSTGGLAFTAYGGGATAPLTVTGASAGALALNNAPVTVTTTSALTANTYTLIAKGGSATGVSGTPGTLTMAGSGLAPGTTGALSVVSGQLILTVTSTSTPTKLAVTSVPTTVYAGTPFSVTVQSQDGSSVAAAVTSQTGVSLANTGGGTIGGNTGNILNATNNVILSSVTLNTAATGVTLTASTTGGMSLTTSAASASINVYSAIPSVASAVTTSSRTSTGTTVGWTNGNGTGRIVVARLNATAAIAPTLGTAYTPSSAGAFNGTTTTGAGNIVVYNGTGATNSVPITNLSAGTAYAYDVYEYNGSSPTISYAAAATSGSVSTLATAPSAPATAVLITAGTITQTAMTVTWTNGTGGAGRLVVARLTSTAAVAPTNGTAYAPSTNGSFTGTTLTGAANGNVVIYSGTASSIAVTNLTANNAYTYDVYEYSGSSTTINYAAAASSASTTTLVTAPTVATGVSVTVNTITSTGMTVTWTNGTGGTGCIVVARLNASGAVAPTGGTSYTPSTSGSFTGTTLTGTANVVIYNGTGTSIAVTNLANASAYAYDVYEYNGSSPTIAYSAKASSASTSTLAVAPTNAASSVSAASIAQTTLTLNWSSGNGTNRIVVARLTTTSAVAPTQATAYTPSAAGSFTGTTTTGAGNIVIYNGALSTIAVTNLSASTSYTFDVYEYNGTDVTAAYYTAGSSDPTTTLALAAPGAPTVGTVTAVNGTASVPFTQPASNGGSAITSYTATSAPGGFTGTLSQAGSGTITVSGLTNGTAYTFTVTATNSTGTSIASAPSNSVTPVLTYCTPNTVSAPASTYISAFSTTLGVTNINNTSTYVTGGYNNFTAQSVSQYPNTATNFSVTLFGGTAGIGIWVDWNQNGDFTDVGDNVYNSAGYKATGTWTGSFTVPSSQVIGSYRMRVIVDFTGPTPTSCVAATGTRGEAEDYTFNVVSASMPILAITGTTSHGSVCPATAANSIQYTITNSGLVPATGVTAVSNDAQFVVSGLSSTTISASGGTATYNVIFTPSTAGAKTATITVASTGSNSPTSSLTGTGISAVTQAVTSSAASPVGSSTATLNGNVTAVGACPATTEKGFVYSLTSVNSDPLVSGTGVTQTPVSGIASGAFTLPLTGLPNGTGYSYKAYVYNGAYTYGSVQSFTTSVPIVNDDCSGAITLTVNSNETNTVKTSGSSEAATQSLSGILCGGYTGLATGDVWYKFVATNSAHNVIVTNVGTFDAVIDVRSGSCNGANISCADAVIGNGTETVSLAGLSIGSTYLVRVYDYNGLTTSAATFNIGVTTPISTATISSPSQVTAAPTYPNTSAVIISKFQVAIGSANSSTLNTVQAITGGTYLAADVNTSGLKLWYNSTNTITGATQFGSSATSTSIGSGETVNFTGTLNMSSSTTTYFFVTADISSGATVGKTINVAAMTSGNFTYALNGSPTKTGSATLSGTITITTPLATEPTTQPSGFSRSAVTTTGMTLSWTAASGGVAGYIVLRTTASGTTYPNTTPVDAITYTAGNTIGNATVEYVGSSLSSAMNSLLTAGSQYSFSIFSYNGSGAATNYYTTSPLQGQPYTLGTEPSTQSSITLSSKTAGSVTLTISHGNGTSSIIVAKAGSTVTADPLDGASGYSFAANVFGSGTDLGSANFIVHFATTATTAVTITGLNANTNYNFAVYSYNGLNSTSNANYLSTTPGTLSVTTLSSTPLVPTNLQFASITQNSFTASFTAPGTSPSGYLVLRRSTSAVTGVPVAGTDYTQGQTNIGSGINDVMYVGASVWTNNAQTGLSDNTAYYYAVYSYNGSGVTTSYSASALTGSQTTSSIPAPVATDATALSSTGFRANWNAAVGANSYRLDVATASDFSTPATIASEGFENSTTLFTQTNGTFYTGSSAAADLPITSPFAVAGTYSYGITSGTATLTSNDINTVGYTGNQLTFRLAAFSIASSGNGVDATDIVNVEISPNGGVNYYSTVRVLGKSNAHWAYSTGSANASTAYDGNVTPVDFQPTSGGDRTTDGYSTVSVTGLPATSNLKIRITLNDDANERWVVDDLTVTGSLNHILTNYNDLTVNSTSQDVTNLTPNTTYYYRVRAVGSNSTSANSNVKAVTTASNPTAQNMTGTGSYCAGGSGVAVGLDGSQTGVNYQLYVGGTTPVGSVVPGTGAALAFGTHTAGTYTASGTANGSVPTIDGTTAMSGSAVVTANALPAAPIVTTPVTYCLNATASALSATGTNLLWYSALTGGTGSATAPTPSTATAGNTSYWVSQTNGSSCEGPRAEIVVTINDLPTTPTATFIQPSCSLATGTITIAAQSGADYSLDNSTYQGSNIFAGKVAGSYTIYVRNASLCVASAGSQVLNAQPSTPTAPIIGAITQPTCALATASIALSGLPAGSWTVTGSPSGSLPSRTGTTATISGLAAGHSYTFTVSNGTCTSVASDAAIVKTQPAVIEVSAGADGFPGLGVPYTMNGSVTPGATIVWAQIIPNTGTGVGTLSSTTILNPVFNGTNVGTIQYRLTATLLGCAANHADVTLLVSSSSPLNWTGNVSNDWHNTGNWLQAVIPTASSNVVIPAAVRYPTISASGVTEHCNSITLEPGATLIDNGKLITGSITVQHDPLALGSWHFISSPVAGAYSSTFEGHYLESFTSAGGYVVIKNAVTPLTAMHGFALYPDKTAFTAPFTGTLNMAASYSFAISDAAGIDPLNTGWNLVGNPFPSTIDWADEADWTKTDVDNAIYIYDGASWRTYVYSAGTGRVPGSRYIAPAQGFFVKAKTGGGMLTMMNTEPLRTHTAATLYKNANGAFPNLVRIAVSGNGYTDDAVVRFMPEATAEFDGDYDAYKRYGDINDAAQLYTLGSIPLAINSLPEAPLVPVGLNIRTAGTYTIAATEMNDLHNVLLEDSETGITTDLSASPYTFTAASGVFEQRFKLLFSMLSVPETKKVETAIYSYQQTVHINMIDQAKGDIYIFNISGQLVAKKLAAQGTNEISLPNAGNYIVKVISKNSTVVRKVFIQK